MKRLPTSITVKPFILGALFGAKPVTLKILNESLQVTQGGIKITVPFEEISDSTVMSKGVLFDNIKFSGHKKTLIAKWLTADDARGAFNLAMDTYSQVIAGDIVKLHHEIHKQMTTRYPRERGWMKRREECWMWKERFKRLPASEVLDSTQMESFKYINHFATRYVDDLSNAQDAYVESQLEQYKTYFDTVESNPLTEKQRIACISDEENNLVIAGAGSGKTSVMMGRAGYLIESNQASSAEILMLAFGRKAADEMSDRIVNKLDGIDVKASTFHSLGQYIIAQVEKGKPSLSKLAEDEKELRLYVDKCFQELMENDDYRDIAVNYFIEYLNEEVDPFGYNKEGDHLQALIDNDIRTLKGEKVKSYQESVIANFLFSQGINYIYEEKYEHETRTKDYRQYQPDFYLPEWKIYIEHYGVDENNNTAPYVDRDKYIEGMEWKRKRHQCNMTLCIETFHYEYKKGVLLSNLKNELLECGVEMRRLKDEEIVEALKNQGRLTEFTALLKDMLQLYKQSNLNEYELENKALSAQNPARFSASVKLLQPIINKYEAYLHQCEDIDFNDMINTAIGYLESGEFQPKWKYIMVDEFQDISGPRAELIRQLHINSSDSSIFCVGDDWQAIYRFAGSDLSYMTDFSKTFGTTCTTKLDMTFRFNNSISDVATKFVTRNPDQIVKKISTQSHVDKPAVSLYRSQNKTEEDQLGNISTVLSSIEKSGVTNPTILILGRYHFVLPSKDMLGQLRQRFAGMRIVATTIHAAKGREADFVVLVNMVSGKHGFPSEKITHPLLEVLLPPSQKFEFAEERRLLYVAITRAKQRSYLVCDMAVPSCFFMELLDNNYDIETEEFDVTENQLLLQQVHCIRCETGSMLPRTGPFGDFFGCSHYPRCTHVEKGCDCCGSLMKREGRYKLCTSAQCDGWAPVCTICGAEMVLRNGKFGEFWGCKNYRSDGVSCGHTENIIPPPQVLS